MPMITVRYVAAQPVADARTRIAELAVTLAVEKLRKEPHVAAVLVEEADPEGWFVGGENPADGGLSTFWMEINVVAGANTKDETTEFVRAAYEGMREILGPLHEECYACARATDGDAYGFGGRTQNQRWLEGQRD